MRVADDVDVAGPDKEVPARAREPQLVCGEYHSAADVGRGPSADGEQVASHPEGSATERDGRVEPEAVVDPATW